MKSKSLKLIQKMADTGKIEEYEIINVPEPMLGVIENLIGEPELYVNGCVAGYKSALEYACIKAKTVKVVLLESQSYTVKDICLLKEV